MNPVPFLWLAAVVGFLLLEASTFSMTSVWFAVGAAAALLTCLFTGSFRVQALVFIVVSALCLLMFRPLAAKLRQKNVPTNGDRNLGREATVLTTVTADRSLLAQNLDAKARRKVVDKVAAAIMLQAWLDSRSPERRHWPGPDTEPEPPPEPDLRTRPTRKHRRG